MMKNSLFEDTQYTSITSEAAAASGVQKNVTPAGKRTTMSIESQYLLLDLNDRRLARANNILGIIAAIIAIIYFIQKISK